MSSHHRTATPSGGVLAAVQHAAVFAGLVFAVVFVATRVIVDRSIDPLAVLLGGIASSTLATAAHRRDVPVVPVGAAIVIAAAVIALGAA